MDDAQYREKHEKLRTMVGSTNGVRETAARIFHSIRKSVTNTSSISAGWFSRNVIHVHVAPDRQITKRRATSPKMRLFNEAIDEIAQRFPGKGIRRQAWRALAERFEVSRPWFIPAERVEEALAFLRTWRP